MNAFLFILIVYSNVLLTFQRPQNEPTNVPVLPKPVLFSWTHLNKGFVWSWHPVYSDEANPILGFKLKVWALEKTKTYTKQENVGEDVVITEYKDVDYDKISELPNYEPAFTKYSYGGNATSARVYGIEPGVFYQFRVQAYSEAGDGPLSEPMSVRAGPTTITTQ